MPLEVLKRRLSTRALNLVLDWAEIHRTELLENWIEPLRDRQFFEQASIDEYAAVCWPNGADLAPELLNEDILASLSAADRTP